MDGIPSSIPANAGAGLRSTWNRGADLLARAVGDTLLALCARVALAAIFFLSGRPKVEGLLTVSATERTTGIRPAGHGTASSISRALSRACRPTCMGETRSQKPSASDWKARTS